MQSPLESLEQWDDFVGSRYQEGRTEENFRDYSTAPAGVREFYRLNHTHQTREFARAKKQEYGSLNRRQMSIWEGLEYLDTLVDDSDPDTDLSQIEHNLQTAEALRRDGQPRWMILTGLIHDLGKVLWLYGEPQWAVVGDTFPVGCAWSDKVVFSEFFRDNPDAAVPEYQTRHGVYEPNCGLSKTDMSWGHDEYLYQITRDYLPEPAQYIIRYHSFYPQHRENAYTHLMDSKDHEMFEWVKKFNPYDLYSKGHAKPDAKALRPYYEELISEFFPEKVRF
jgi:inositol oxygenase